VTITYPSAFTGSETLTFKVTDSEGLSDTDQAVFTVTQCVMPNAPPAIEGIPDLVFIEDSGLHDSVIDLWSYASDAETPDSGLTFTIISQSNAAVVNCVIDPNRFIDCTTQTNQNGYSDVTVQVADPEGLTDTDTFRVTVTPVNDAPVISGAGVADASIDSCHVFATFDLDDIVSDVDNLDSEITWTVTGNTQLTVTIDPATHVVTITYPSAFTGSETLTFTATDSQGLTASDTAVFTITQCVIQNSAPELSGIPDQELEENSGSNSKIIDLWDYAEDDESSDAELEFSITKQTNTDVVTCSINSDRYINCKVKAGKTGSSYVTVQVKDPEGLTDTDTFKVTIIDPEDDDGDPNTELTISIISITYDGKVKAGDYLHLTMDLMGDDRDVKTTISIEDLGVYETFSKVDSIYVLIPETAKLGKHEMKVEVKNAEGYKDVAYRDIEVVSGETAAPKSSVSLETSSVEETTGSAVASHQKQPNFYMQGLKGISLGLLFLLSILVVLLIIMRLRSG